MSAVRQQNLKTAIDLLPLIPPQIEGSTARTCPANLIWMIGRLQEEVDTFPLDKMGRWIGFIQGVLALSGNLDVDEERARTRERFQQAYRDTGQVVPQTMNMPED